ncbi:separase [Artemisia annua]|uniref:separase n=1 Tax=Artemisia annua TaxID=35608 RepID=A0A2U1Q0Y8_ARTAN|nr:separase [Artemisia annua]
MESGTTGADYHSRLRSIKSFEEAGEAEKAKLEKFCLVESFSCLLERLMGDDESFLLSERGLEEWKVFKGSLIMLVRSRNMTRAEVIGRLTPLTQMIIPLLRYLDEEDRRILDREFCVITEDVYEYGQKICDTIAENASEFSLPILRSLLHQMALTAKIRQRKFLDDFMGVSCDVVKKLETVSNFRLMVASIFRDLEVIFSEDLSVSTVLGICSMALRAKGVGDLGELELELKDFKGIDIALETQNTYVYLALELLFGAICKMVRRLNKDLISRDSGLPNVHNALQSFQSFSISISKSQSWKESHMEQELNDVIVAMVLYTLKVTNKEDVEDNFPREILVADSCGLNDFRFAIIYLFKLGKAMGRTSRINEATMLLQLSCESAWKGILVFCEEPDPMSDELSSLITNTCETSAILMCMIYEHGDTKTINTLKYYLMSWCDAQLLCEKIPQPLAIVEAWVHMQYKYNQDPQAWDTIKTTHALMSSLDKITINALQILTEQELEAYADMKDLNPKLFDVMEKKLTELLNKIINTTECRLVKSINLTQNAMQLLASRVKNLRDCEKFTSEAICIMLELLEERDCDLYSLYSILAEAYCLRALCTQEANPKTERIMKDISQAVKFWYLIPTLSKKDVNLLFHIFDFLSVKGNGKHHVQIYNIMLKYFSMQNADGLKNLCSILWKSRRLSHAICGSPICGVFLNNLSHYCDWSDDVDTWKRDMEDINAAGFEHKLTLSTHVPYHQDASMNISIINQVEEFSTDLIQREPLSSYAQFLVGHLYYDLAESFIAKGLIVKALHYAEEAFKLRTELLNKMFHIETQFDEKVSSRYNYQTFTMFPEVATTAWSHDEGSSDSQNFLLTPWNTLQCFLESSLQYGILEEDVDTAEKILVGGMNISSLHDLRLFSSRFLCALGKFYTKQHNWDLAEQKINEAAQIWKDVKSHVSCSECNTIFDISIKHANGDVCLDSKSNTRKGMSDALSCYQYGKKKLNSSMWENEFSCPSEGCARTMFCCASGISWGPVAKDNVCCWHCQQSRITKSRSLQGVIYIQREYIRRSISIRLLANIGKCYKVWGDNSNEQKFLFERLSLFVTRSTYKSSNFSVSKKFIFEIIDKRLSGFAYTIDYATLIYETCCFYLRNTSKMDPVSMQKLVRGLKISFLLSRQVPILHREISRILAILYYVNKEPAAGNGPSAQQWTAYFHQSSIGTYFNNRLIVRMRNIQGQNPMEDIIEEDLEQCVLNFFKKLPPVPIVCFSMLGDDSLLPSNLLTHSSTSVWIQLSRLKSEDVPIVDIIPIESPFTDTIYRDLGYTFPETKWRNVTIDKVASVFNSVLSVKRFLVKQLVKMRHDEWLKEMEALDQTLSRLLRCFFIFLVLKEIPWESMPFLRLEDTYRMPCVMSIFFTLERSSHFIKDNATFRAVNPRKLYYVLNPENNLQESEKKLLPVFKDKRFKGKVREFPTPEKLNKVLTTNDIFIYSGHGRGLEYMSTHKIRELDCCSSLLLMACSSGRLNLNGSHNPTGLILDYIISGSPSIASTLWPIRGEDAYIMIESMVNDWTKAGTYKTMGLSVAMARQKCKLPFIEGAGFICYGVPTRVKIEKFKGDTFCTGGNGYKS